MAKRRVPKMYAWRYVGYIVDRKVEGLVIESSQKRALTLARAGAARRHRARPRDVEIVEIRKLRG